jgi:hypothetical protein
MKLEYISHSCFLIETQNTKIALDPWIMGTAYGDQWHLFPKPVDTSGVEDADLVLISHGHEDHFHSRSLKQIKKNSHIFFPFQWRAGVKGFLKHLGFEAVTEALSFRTYRFRNIKITYLGYSMESVIVIESEGQVIVNINDALNSNHKTAVDFLLKRIRKKWPQVDILLSGWSGAGYFPNKVKYKDKDDMEVARIREQYFADNFCKFTHYLKPDIAIPFAPGFVLLNDENRWINEIKFPRKIVDDYYKKNFSDSSDICFPIMYPGDVIENKEHIKNSVYHESEGDLAMYEQLDDLFKKEIKVANHAHMLEEAEVARLKSKLEYWINRNKSIYPETVWKDAVFTIFLKDVDERNCFNITNDENKLIVTRSDSANSRDRLTIQTKGKLLSDNLDHEWGGDLLTIGYGFEAEVFEELSLEKNLDIVCVRLISRYPIFKEDVTKHLGRMAKYYMTNPALTNLWINQKIKLKPYVNKFPFNERDHWITYNKCELCKVCKIPELEFEDRPSQT